MTCTHTPSHIAANWAIVSPDGGVEDRFVTVTEAVHTFVTGGYPAEDKVAWAPDPDPCGEG